MAAFAVMSMFLEIVAQQTAVVQQRHPVSVPIAELSFFPEIERNEASANNASVAGESDLKSSLSPTQAAANEIPSSSVPAIRMIEKPKSFLQTRQWTHTLPVWPSMNRTRPTGQPTTEPARGRVATLSIPIGVDAAPVLQHAQSATSSEATGHRVATAQRKEAEPGSSNGVESNVHLSTLEMAELSFFPHLDPAKLPQHLEAEPSTSSAPSPIVHVVEQGIDRAPIATILQASVKTPNAAAAMELKTSRSPPETAVAQSPSSNVLQSHTTKVEPPTDAAGRRKLARNLVARGRAEFAAGNFERARTLALQALELAVEYNRREDSPRALLADLNSAALQPLR